MQGRRRKEPDPGEPPLLDVREADGTKGRRSAARRVPVMLPYPFPGPFDYSAPPDLHPQPGDIVMVPLNRREEIGVVWDHSAEDGVPDRKLKPVSGLIDTPPMRPALRRFVDWVASYTLSPPGEVMAMALRVVPQGVSRPPIGWVRVDPLPDTRITEARRRYSTCLLPNNRGPPATWRTRQAWALAWFAAWPMLDCWCRQRFPSRRLSRIPTPTLLANCSHPTRRPPRLHCARP